MPDLPLPSKPNVLLVDDEPAITQSLRRSLRQSLGHHVLIEICDDGAEAIRLLHARPFDVVVSDLHMPGMDGIQLLRQAAQIQPLCARLILTAAADFGMAQTAVNSVGVFRYLTKPWREATLAQDVSDAIEHSRTLRKQQHHATAWAAAQGEVSAQTLEKLRLEAMEPGITHVEWAPDGSVVMPDLDDLGNMP